jgi:hypothetical protein
MYEICLNINISIHNKEEVVAGYHVDISASREQILAANDGAGPISQAVISLY